VKRVLLNKWTRRPANGSLTPDAAIAEKFHETFIGLLSASKQAATRELFPMTGARMGRVLPCVRLSMHSGQH
jgi:hypothetical protein